MIVREYIPKTLNINVYTIDVFVDKELGLVGLKNK